MNKKIAKNLLSILIILVGVLVFKFAFAQDFGTAAVNNGLSGSLATGDPRTIAARIVNLALGFLGVIALGLIIYAGFLWMTSAGEEEKVSKAKKLLTGAVIGLVIILSSWLLATFLINKLSGAVSGTNGNDCLSGESIACGCDSSGTKVCVDGAWSGCIGYDCSCIGSGCNNPTSCDGSSNPGCQATDDICAPEDYCSDSCTCQPKGEAGVACDGDASTPTCDADNNLCAQFLACDTNTCTCFGPPVITEVSPAGGFCQDNPNKACVQDSDCTTSCDQVTPNGAANNFVTIYGKNFGEYSSSTSRVVFTGGSAKNGRNPSEINPVCVNFWQDNQIIVAVPNGASSGALKVISQDGSEDTTDNDYGPKIIDFVSNSIARPGLCLISPDKGQLNSSVSYQGINLYSGRAYFGNYQTNVQGFDSDFSHPSGLSGKAATPNIRSGVSGSFVINNIDGNQEKSNYLRFVKENNPNDGPFIASFSPTQGTSGQYVTITGSSFGNVRGNSHVYFGDTEASYIFPAVCASSVWSDTQIIVKVPEVIDNGNYLIRISLGDKVIDSEKVNPNIFKVDDTISLKTSLCKLEPKQGAVATPVKLYGEYFGQVNRDGAVQFNPDNQVYGIIKKDKDADVLAVEVPANSLTGPVKVVKNGEWGNSLNFEVAACVTDAECPGQVCCPSNTYKKGRCVATLSECLTDIPTSVFEWDFSTGFSNPDPDSSESCGTLAAYFGSCQVGAFCPNVPGVCSPYGGGTKRTVATCDFSCDSVIGCGLGAGLCNYDSSLNKCIKSGSAGNCSLPQNQTFDIGGKSTELPLSCNSAGKWEAKVGVSCPTGWTKGVGDICIDESSSCSVCGSDFTCEKIGNQGSCVSKTICPAGSVCENNLDITKPDTCVVIDKASCDCCCRIDNSAQDCCAPLKCAGTCGQDSSDDGAGFGMCSGCAGVGTTAAEHDAACNCTGHSGQYCSISNENPGGVCTDCSGLESLESCSDHSSACCFDAKKTAAPEDDACRGGLGTEITGDSANPDFGYCGYYSCFNTSTPPIGDPLLCASSTPMKLGKYKDPFACADGCSVPTDACALLNGNKDECLASGTCCFDGSAQTCSGSTETDPNTGKALCCGCTSDSDCSADTPATVGCGLDSCCSVRPSVIDSLPQGGTTNVCRNSMMEITFDQTMDVSSFNANTLLLEERAYGNGECPNGTFTYQDGAGFVIAHHNWFARIFDRVKVSVAKMFGSFNNSALADEPDPNKLYCTFPGNTSGEYFGSTTVLRFAPKKLLAPGAKYFLVIKGDQDLNSKSGIINLAGVGFNGLGLDQGGAAKEGELLTFNGKSYKNSHILQFKTLSDKAENSGICAVSYVKISPYSYLFKTIDNDLDENDADANNKTFDTKKDKDKVFTATAYSSDKQIVQPVTGYFWEWKFGLSDPSVASIGTATNLGVNKVLISAKSDMVDAETELSATVSMDRFLNSSSSIDPGCVCSDATCSSNCHNYFSAGDNFVGKSNIYVLICDNPWPPIKIDGTWSPWFDNCDGAIGACSNFNYKFYYCRDAGKPGTFDDLPVIDQSVIRGQSPILACSSDNSACSSQNAVCGADRNGDGSPDGICIWNVLKELFFFGQENVQDAEITNAIDKKTGGAITLQWKTSNLLPLSYKIYYGESGKAMSMSKEIKQDVTSCSLSGSEYLCHADINSLKNGQAYTFRVSVLSTDRIESTLSNERAITPTDATAPTVPSEFNVVSNDASTIKFTWKLNSDDTVFYRLYRGTKSGLYGESFDSASGGFSLILNKSKLTLGNNYFAITALDKYNNESAKSEEKIFAK